MLRLFAVFNLCLVSIGNRNEESKRSKQRVNRRRIEEMERGKKKKGDRRNSLSYLYGHQTSDNRLCVCGGVTLVHWCSDYVETEVCFLCYKEEESEGGRMIS